MMGGGWRTEDFRIAGLRGDDASSAAVDEMARVARLLARLSRASAGAQSRREA